MVRQAAQVILLAALFFTLPGASSAQHRGANAEHSKTTSTFYVANKEERIQLNKLVDRELGLELPLTQIIKVVGGEGFGTAAFLPECRIISTAHVLASIAAGQPRNTVDPKNPIINRSFRYHARDKSERTLVGSFVVIWHGSPSGADDNEDGLEDVAIGYDRDCQSKTRGLGHVQITRGGAEHAALALQQAEKPFFTASYTQVDVNKDANGDYGLYIDSKCGVISRHLKNYFYSNCSIGPSGSGALLMAAQRNSQGALIIVAYGMFQGGDYGNVRDDVPNTGFASGFAPFNHQLIAKLRPHLSGPVNVDAESGMNPR